MKRLIVLTTLALITNQANADGLFLGADWSQARSIPAVRDPQVRAEDNDGIRAHKLVALSVPAYAPRYAGRTAPDGICDQLQPAAYDYDGFTAYKHSQATHALYTSGSCASVYYPGFTFFGGQPNMALAPHWNGQPDFVPSFFSYMDWTDPRYNPWMRYGG